MQATCNLQSDGVKLQVLQLEDKAEQRQKKRRENAERKRYNIVIDATNGMQVSSKVHSRQPC